MTHLNEQAIHLAGGDPIAAGAIIVATGREGPELIPEIPLRPRKGHLLITDRYPDFLRHQLVELGYLRRAHAREESSVSFNLQPRATGQVLIGSSRQYSSDGAVEPAILGEGLPLTAPLQKAVSLVLLKCEQLNSQGTLLLRYQVESENSK